MICVLGYNNSESEFLNNIISKNNIEFQYSLMEREILAADKIILPHPLNFNLAYRRISMMNLFSLLRLIKKPILGINDGFKFMCNQILSKQKCGLGFFPMDQSQKEETEIDLNFVVGKIEVKEGSKLVSNLISDKSLKFNNETQSLICQYATSTILYEKVLYSLTCELKNYYSLEINFEENPEVSEIIVQNFLNL
ncbi:MAG: hypothetical protein KDC88_13905 [Ignavibacteriae bacterium]|nr:hypothetical protein [Ignavibacteriota bacterium]MCB9259899.1 hypothetical protein [Ignavibacteriales bacterium]